MSCLIYGRFTWSGEVSSTTLRIYCQGPSATTVLPSTAKEKRHTWMLLNRARCRAAISWYSASTASVLLSSRYSLYMLCVPERLSYLIQIPKFLTLSGRFSWMMFSDTISPVDFLTLRSFMRKYQKRDLATTSFGAKMRMRYSFGVGLVSVGR